MLRLRHNYPGVRSRLWHLLTPLLLTGCLQCAAPEDSLAQIEQLRFDLNDSGHRFGGFGVSLRPENIVQHQSALVALGFTHVRFEPGPSWGYVEPPLTANASATEIARYVRDNFDYDADRTATMRRAARILKERRIKTVLINYHIPFAWLSGDEDRRLQAEHTRRLTHLWLGVLAHLRDQAGFEPEFIEIANEPDGNWNGAIPPQRYYAILQALRTQMDAAGFERIQILGPGISNLNRQGLGARWVDAADQDALAALGGWSFHAWDEAYMPHSKATAVARTWTTLRRSLSGKPARPVFLTEFATDARQFAGRNYHSNSSAALFTAVETRAYAVRVLCNAIIHLNNGVQVPMLWRLTDHNDDRRSWGLISAPATGSYQRPLLHLLQRLAPMFPPGAEIVPPGEPQNYARTAALLLREDRGRLQLLLLNHSYGNGQIDINLAGARKLTVGQSRCVQLETFQPVNQDRQSDFDNPACQPVITQNANGQLAVQLARRSMVSIALGQ